MRWQIITWGFKEPPKQSRIVLIMISPRSIVQPSVDNVTYSMINHIFLSNFIVLYISYNLTCTLYINLSCIYFVRKFWSGNGFFSSGIFHCCTKIWSNRKTVVVDTPFGSLFCGRNNIRLQFIIWAIIYSGNIFVIVINAVNIVLIEDLNIKKD